ncbi:MAG: SDR family oxidoreductase [Myxococcaceae bacterium]|nr:SDR family oxidoreductase [Myxococcaceae bacterium]
MGDTKIAVITGGSRGLGRNGAIALAKRGVHSVITYQSKRDAAEETVREVEKLGAKAVALQLDTSKPGSFADFAGALKSALQATWKRDRFDYLVNNAGTGLHKGFAETSEADFDALVNVHLKGPYFLTQRLLPLIADGGRILNVSTGLARFVVPGYSAYASMKGGIEVLTRYLAKELGPRGISVNTLAPGAIATDFNGGAVRDNPQMQAMLSGFTALGRVGQADDIGPVIASLLDEGNRWVTGQRIEASGGMFL